MRKQLFLLEMRKKISIYLKYHLFLYYQFWVLRFYVPYGHMPVSLQSIRVKLLFTWLWVALAFFKTIVICFLLRSHLKLLYFPSIFLWLSHTWYSPTYLVIKTLTSDEAALDTYPHFLRMFLIYLKGGCPIPLSVADRVWHFKMINI